MTTAVSEREAGIRISRGRAWLIAVVATLAMTVSYVDRQVVSAVGASVRKALDIDAAHFGLLASAFSLSYLVVAPLAGSVVDRIGARRGLIASILVWSFVSGLHALVPSFAVLCGLRVALGAAEAPSFPAAAQAVARSLPKGERSAAFGLLFTGSSLGAAIAAPLALRLDVAYGFRVAFLVTSAVGLSWLPFWLVLTRSPQVQKLLAGADAAGVATIAEPQSEPPPKVAIADLDVLRAMLLVLASAPGLMFVFVWMPQYLELGRGMPKASLPQYVWLPPLGADAGMVGFGMLASYMDRRAGRVRAHWELVAAAAALETLFVLVPSVPGAWPSVATMALAASGGGGLYTLLTSDMMARIHPSIVSAAGGFTAAAQSIVYVALNPLVGVWIDRSRSFDGSLAMVGAVALPGALAWVLWARARDARGAARAEPGAAG